MGVEGKREAGGVWLTVRPRGIMFNPCLSRACSELISSPLEEAAEGWGGGGGGHSDGCYGNGDSAKPFPFTANEASAGGGSRDGRGGG